MALKDDFRPSKVESIFSFKYHYIIVNLLAWTILCTLISFSNGLLFPRESESREIKELNGIWNFRVDNSSTRTAGFDKEWYQKPLKQVHVTLIFTLYQWSNDPDLCC